MEDSELFSKKKIVGFNGKIRKTKYLLRPKYQEKVLREVKRVARGIKRKRGVKRVWVGGSVVKKQLGKYLRKWNERLYSDIDLYVLADRGINLKKVGFVKRLHKAKGERYFRLSVADKDGEPMKMLERFSVDVWLCSPKSFQKDLKRFPDLLDGAIEV